MTDIYPTSSDRAEDLTSEQLLALFASAAHDETILSALQESGTHLLVGSRGTGKTTLLKVAAERLCRNPSTARVPIYIRFSNYLSTYNSAARIQKGYHPFQDWVYAKIVHEIQTQTQKGGSSAHLTDLPLQSYIERLETHHQDKSVADPSANAAALGISEQAILNFARIDQVQSKLLAQLDLLGIEEVVLLLDEAAQSFAEELQPQFFQLVKHLRHSRVAIKVATYPHVTNYGPDFDVGHDAIILPIERQIETEEGISFFEAFLEKRYGNSPLGASLRSSEVTRHLLIKGSGGNPRWLIHMLSSFSPTGGGTPVNSTTAMGVVKELPGKTLWPYLRSLGDRLRSKRRHVETAIQLLQVFIEDLQEANANNISQDPERGSSTCYVSVSVHKSLPFRVHAALRILQYAGIIYPRGPKRIRGRESAEMFLLHPAIQIKENTLFGNIKPSATAFVSALTSPSLKKFRSYTRNSPKLLEFAEQEKEDVAFCRNCNAEVGAEARFCSNCGTPVERSSLYEELRNASSSELELTPGIKARLVRDGRFPTVGSILDAEGADLEQIYMIGPQRSKIIIYAAEEFVAG